MCVETAAVQYKEKEYCPALNMPCIIESESVRQNATSAETNPQSTHISALQRT